LEILGYRNSKSDVSRETSLFLRDKQE